MQCHRVAVLSVLDEKDHEEGNDRRAGVYSELPRITVAEVRPGNRPNNYGEGGNGERNGLAGYSGGGVSKSAKKRHAASKRPQHCVRTKVLSSLMTSKWSNQGMELKFLLAVWPPGNLGV